MGHTYIISQEKLNKFVELRRKLSKYVSEFLYTSNFQVKSSLAYVVLRIIFEIADNGIMNCGEYSTYALCKLYLLGIEAKLAKFMDHTVAVVVVSDKITMIIDLWQKHFSRKCIYNTDEYITMINSNPNAYVGNCITEEDIILY